jgi:hypothetical protein
MLCEKEENLPSKRQKILNEKVIRCPVAICIFFKKKKNACNLTFIHTTSTIRFLDRERLVVDSMGFNRLSSNIVSSSRHIF